jgi:hypothetical protein
MAQLTRAVGQVATSSWLFRNIRKVAVYARFTPLAGLLLAIAAPAVGLAQQQQSWDGTYMGTLVCEHLPGTGGILRAPLDMIVTGTTIIAARPIFNRDGSRVVGTEIATGTINADGTSHLTSTWGADGGAFKGTYSGMSTTTGGTLTGTEAWTRTPEYGGNALRTCYGAYVKSPMPSH